MQVTFPCARDRTVALPEMLAAWIKYCQIAFQRADWQSFIMPVNHVKEGIPKHPGFDALCRIMAGGGYVHTMQATDSFFAQNGQIFLKLPKATRNATTGRPVHGVRLTATAIAEWKNSAPIVREDCLDGAERILLADQGDAVIDGALSGDVGSFDSESHYDPKVRERAAGDLSRLQLMELLVNQIHETAFQAHYLRKPVKNIVSHAEKGWQQRHQSYFWPNPTQGLDENSSATSGFVGAFRALVKKLPSSFSPVPAAERVWGTSDRSDAERLAKTIFTWGGVRQNDPSSEDLFKVVCNAVAGHVIFPGALMNSGWTKIAAFASEAAADRVQPQVIWDSRVSTAVIENLDRFVSPTASALENLNIRLIPGRGGFRVSLQASLRSKGWKYGWGPKPWDAHFTGATIIREIRDLLNGDLHKFGPPLGSDSWSVRSIEMALFMEGVLNQEHFADGYDFPCRDATEPVHSPIKILKLHGSVNWSQESETNTVAEVEHKKVFLH